MIPILKTKLPTCEDLAPYIHEIDSNRIYSNNGPLNHKLILRLSKVFDIEVDNICLVSSGTSGLLACLWVLMEEIPKNTEDIIVGLPAWTFIATAQVPFILGAQVIFIDVDNNGFVAPTDNINIDILIVVAPFGERVDIEYWKSYSLSTGVKILFDCAASYSTLVADEIPLVVSTHATKGFSTCEGGLVVSRNSRFIEKVKSFSNFSLLKTRVPNNFGLNLKLSEINCAYGLAFLSNKEKYLDPYLDQVEVYNTLISSSCSLLKSFNSPFMRTTYNILLPKGASIKDEIILRLMTNYGIEVRDWWGKPMYLHPHFANSLQNSSGNYFPMSDLLSNRTIGIPMGGNLNKIQQKYIVHSLIEAANPLN